MNTHQRISPFVFSLSLLLLTPILFADVDLDFRLGKGLYNQQFFERAIPPLERVRTGDATPRQLEEALFLLGATIDLRSASLWAIAVCVQERLPGHSKAP